VTATVRDATHTLDGILGNQTMLPVEEHIRTEMVFGIFDLLGPRFAPRIRDLDRQRLYKYGPPPAVDIDELLHHKLRPELIHPLLGRSAAARRLATPRMGARLATPRASAGRLQAQPHSPGPCRSTGG
jgi:Tn3 transposase DDE domain